MFNITETQEPEVQVSREQLNKIAYFINTSFAGYTPAFSPVIRMKDEEHWTPLVDALKGHEEHTAKYVQVKVLSVNLAKEFVPQQEVHDPELDALMSKQETVAPLLVDTKQKEVVKPAFCYINLAVSSPALLGDDGEPVQFPTSVRIPVDAPKTVLSVMLKASKELEPSVPVVVKGISNPRVKKQVTFVMPSF